ncbi:hypothetical protein midi_00729 [Candidatus Midichloria mitochondrii IricVA]|uniref:Uncharacterized protein n=1 Tax=Midichloria mitochondrii (strain IricVA) TaxID=696127 RepID=F7XWH1_MIDMI|nr:hypothetical protein midi_00729 [Candidatus Midichloria mitochondrii IricVA]
MKFKEALSRMMGNCHARFSGDKRVATLFCYHTKERLKHSTDTAQSLMLYCPLYQSFGCFKI